MEEIDTEICQNKIKNLKEYQKLSQFEKINFIFVYVWYKR